MTIFYFCQIDWPGHTDSLTYFVQEPDSNQARHARRSICGGLNHESRLPLLKDCLEVPDELGARAGAYVR